MKKLLLFFCGVLFAHTLGAQAPQKMSYQAVIRDASNNLLTAGTNVGLRFTIRQGSPSGTIEYQETQVSPTNANSLISVEIGAGTQVSTQAFSDIDWGNGSYYLEVEADPTGMSNYTITGVSQLLSVPYALYAANAVWQQTGNDIYYDAGKVGIGSSTFSSPTALLEICGNQTDADGNIPGGVLAIKNNNYSRYITTTYSDIAFRNSQILGIRGRGTSSSPVDVQAGDRVFGMYGQVYAGGQKHVRPIASIEYFVGDSSKSGVMTFSTLDDTQVDRDEHMRIDQKGHVGIGTIDPKTKLNIKGGDVYLEDSGTGVILKSANGNCWKVTVDNFGALQTVQISCP